MKQAVMFYGREVDVEFHQLRHGVRADCRFPVVPPGWVPPALPKPPKGMDPRGEAFWLDSVWWPAVVRSLWHDPLRPRRFKFFRARGPSAATALAQLRADIEAYLHAQDVKRWREQAGPLRVK